MADVVGEACDVPLVKDVRKSGGRGRGRGGRGGRGRSGPSRSEPTFAPLPPGVCCHFANGLRCRFTDACKFRHEVPQLPGQPCGGPRPRFYTGAYRGRGAGKGGGGPAPGPALNPDAPAFVPASDDVSHLPAQVVVDEPDKEPKGKPRRRQPKKRAGGGYFVRERREEAVEDEEEHKEKEPKPYVPFNQRRPATNPRRGLRLKRSVVTDETLRELRDGELAYLQRRYPKAEEAAADSLGPGQSGFTIAFSPTDPDWAFDVRSLRLSLVFPPEYPLNLFTVSLAAASEGEQEQLPELLARHIDKAMAAKATELRDAQEEKGIVEPALRAFLLWLDRGLEALFVAGLKAVRMDIQARQSGISFVQLAGQPKADDQPPAEELQNLAVDTEGDSEEEDEDTGEEDESEEESSSEEETGATGTGGQSSQGLRPGEAEVRMKAEWSPSVASISLRKLAMLVSCARCHAKKEAPLISGLRPGAESEGRFTDGCEGCGLAWRGSARALLAHEHSRTLGAVKVEGAVALDLNLLCSELSVVCFGCDSEHVLRGLAYGSLHRTWCNACNRKLELRVDSVRFHTPTPVDQAALLQSVKGAKSTGRERKPPKDGRIKEGLPLPDNGTCKHYKKSFRWFRFPCCGKIFPCDLCHEEAESHEMKLANRIICGYCAKEQPYQGTKGCVACGGSVVALRTTHWEGGKGCRNKNIMSANDKQKFNGLAKTTSNHKKALLDAKKKKKKKTKTAE